MEPTGMLSKQMSSPTPSSQMMAQDGMMSMRQQGRGGKFNGDINVNGKMIHVTDGLLDGSDDQHKVFVAADGSVVFNEKRQVLGSLDENNVLQKPTPELVEKLKSLGIAEAQ